MVLPSGGAFGGTILAPPVELKSGPTLIKRLLPFLRRTVQVVASESIGPTTRCSPELRSNFDPTSMQLRSNFGPTSMQLRSNFARTSLHLPRKLPKSCQIFVLSNLLGQSSTDRLRAFCSLAARRTIYSRVSKPARKAKLESTPGRWEDKHGRTGPSGF